MTDPIAIRHLRRAIALACQSVASGGGPFGAVIARGDEIVMDGSNRVTIDLDPTAHAEVTAIRRACAKLGRFDLRGMTLYSSCEPCPMCLASIHWARLDGAYFAGTRWDAAAAGFDDASGACRRCRCWRMRGKHPSRLGWRSRTAPPTDHRARGRRPAQDRHAARSMTSCPGVHPADTRCRRRSASPAWRRPKSGYRRC
jgi:guanine deaminase